MIRPAAENDTGTIFSLIKELAGKYDCTVAQFAIIWQFQMNNIALVKSVNPQRIKDNFKVPEIVISDEDLKKMKVLEGDRIGPDPNHVNF